MTTLVISTEWERGGIELHPFADIVRPPLHRVNVMITLYGPNGLKSVRYTWKMEARGDGHNEERLRDELHRSTWWERDVWSRGDALHNDIGEVIVNDPHDILSWLCPGQDLKDLFTEKMRLNDQPVRLPAPNTGTV